MTVSGGEGLKGGCLMLASAGRGSSFTEVILSISLFISSATGPVAEGVFSF